MIAFIKDTEDSWDNNVPNLNHQHFADITPYMHKHRQHSDLDTQLVQARMYSVKRGIPKLQQRCFDTGTVRGSIPLILCWRELSFLKTYIAGILNLLYRHIRSTNSKYKYMQFQSVAKEVTTVRCSTDSVVLAMLVVEVSTPSSWRFHPTTRLCCDKWEGKAP